MEVSRAAEWLTMFPEIEAALEYGQLTMASEVSSIMFIGPDLQKQLYKFDIVTIGDINEKVTDFGSCATGDGDSNLWVVTW